MDKIFKAYVKLINSFHKTYEERRHEIEKTTDFRISHLKSQHEKQIKEQMDQNSILSSGKNFLESELEKLKIEFSSLTHKHNKISKDNFKMNFILNSNDKKMKSMQEDAEYFKFRVREIKDKYQEADSDDEAEVRKLFSRFRPTQISTDVDDLEDYIKGLPVEEHRPTNEELKAKLLQRAEEMKRQKRRNIPVSEICQTDPPKGVNFGIQIVDGEEVIPFVDHRSKSVEFHPLKKLDLLDSDQLLKAGLVEQEKYEHNIQRGRSARNRMPTPHEFDISKSRIQKFLTSTDLKKVSSIDEKLYQKLLAQMNVNQDNFD